MTSLYGHMRNHPERNWRGIKPPIPENENNQFPTFPVSGLENDGNNNLGPGFLFPGWLKTGRRTRTRPGKSLMTIPASDKALSGSDNEGYDFSVIGNFERVTKNLPPKKRKLESAFSSNVVLPNRLLIPNGSEKSRKNVEMPNPVPESSKKEKDLVLNDNINAYKNPVRARKYHVCDICYRSFKSYQALGGHKSHHNNNQADEIMRIGENNESSTTFANSVVVKGKWCCGVVHRCPFCDRMFSKGQALGGHKRHCRRTMYCGGGQETRDGPMGFSFDLNELPPEWVPDVIGIGMGSLAYK